MTTIESPSAISPTRNAFCPARSVEGVASISTFMSIFLFSSRSESILSAHSSHGLYRLSPQRTLCGKENASSVNHFFLVSVTSLSCIGK
jgi:hypothetical protein